MQGLGGGGVVENDHTWGIFAARGGAFRCGKRFIRSVPSAAYLSKCKLENKRDLRQKGGRKKLPDFIAGSLPILKPGARPNRAPNR